MQYTTKIRKVPRFKSINFGLRRITCFISLNFIPQNTKLYFNEVFCPQVSLEGSLNFLNEILLEFCIGNILVTDYT